MISAIIGLAGLANSVNQGSRQNDLTREQLDIQREMNAEQLRLANLQEERSAESWGIYKDNYLPNELKLLDEANPTAEKYEAEAGKANADVTQAFKNARAQTNRQMSRYGVDPTSGKGRTMMTRDGNSQALASVNAQNKARDTVDNTARSLRVNLANLGRGHMANANSTMAGAASGINAAAGTNAQMINTGRSIGAGYGADAGAWMRNLAGQDWSFGSNSSGVSGVNSGSQQDNMLASQNDWDFADGGEVVGPGTGISDEVPINVSNGEYIIPADVKEKKGTEFFDKLLEKYHTPVAYQNNNGNQGFGTYLPA